jgi:hypothetical protein
MGFEIEVCINKLLSNKNLSEYEIFMLCKKSSEILKEESNILKLTSPICLVGKKIIKKR